MKKSLIANTAFIFFLFCYTGNTSAQDLLISDAQTITGEVTYDNVTIEAGGILTLDGILNVNQNMEVDSGGFVTHSIRYEDGLVLNVAGDLSISEGGGIDVTGRGLRGGGTAGSIFGLAAEAYDQNGQIISGSSSAAGGSYGGRGGARDIASNQNYGNIESPDFLGSGGGISSSGFSPRGGNGGGRITINTTNIIVGGGIKANGSLGTESFGRYGGSGSGGSIKISATNVSGTGIIETNGAIGVQTFPSNAKDGGGGGGGRIAIVYDNLNLTLDQIHSLGGTKGYTFLSDNLNASQGSIYLKQNNEEAIVIMDNNSSISNHPAGFLTAVSVFKQLVFSEFSNTLIGTGSSSTIEVQDSILVNTNAIVVVESGISIINNSANSELLSQSNGSITFLEGSSVDLNATNLDGGSLEVYIDFNTQNNNNNNFVIQNNGSFQIDGNTTSMELPFFNSTNIISGYFGIGPNSTLNIVDNQITVGSEVTLNKDGKFGSADQIANIDILDQGVITHSNRLLPGLVLNCTNLDIQTGGRINVSAKGLLGGNNGSAFGVHGETFDEGGNIVQGSLGSNQSNVQACCGGSYGGISPGPDSNSPYGIFEDPIWLGSGGGSGFSSFAGNGGGRITIDCGNLINDGAILANGQNGENKNNVVVGQISPGGSGGSIKIIANSLNGTGVIHALGGNGWANYTGRGTTSGGGGGRIATFSENIGLPINNFLARGGNTDANRTGSENFRGSAGTIYVQGDIYPNGLLIIDNDGNVSSEYTPYVPLQNVETFIVRNASKILIDENLELLGKDNFRVSGEAILDIEEGASLSIENFDENNIEHGSINLCKDCILDILTNRLVINNQVILFKDGKFGTDNTIDDLIILSGGKVSHSQRNLDGLVLNVLDSLIINTGGAIDVSGEGLSGGNQNSAFAQNGEAMKEDDLMTIVSGAIGLAAGSAGGSYGGKGGEPNATSLANPIYSCPQEPFYLGSGGGGVIGEFSGGGNGGGKVLIASKVALINGNILSNGASSRIAGGGGGSGGSIYFLIENLLGTGQILANGANDIATGSTFHGAGGGGRVVVLSNINSFDPLNAKALGGSQDLPGEEGSVIFESCNYQTNVGVKKVIDPQGIIPADSIIIPKVVLRNYGTELAIFKVYMDIGFDYLDSTTVALQPLQETEVEFSPWKASITGTYTYTCSTQMDGDDCIYNNEISNNLTIDPGEGPLVIEISPNSGGNTGNLTTKISGQRFRENLNVWLDDGNGNLNYAINIIFEDATIVYATFDLVNQPLGFYDLVVENPDGQNTRLSNGFEIEKGPLAWGGSTSSQCLSFSDNTEDFGQLFKVTANAPAFVRDGTYFLVSICYCNASNIDIPNQSRTLSLSGGFIFPPSSTGNNDEISEISLKFNSEIDGVIRSGFSNCSSYRVYAVPTLLGKFKINLK